MIAMASILTKSFDKGKWMIKIPGIVKLDKAVC